MIGFISLLLSLTASAAMTDIQYNNLKQAALDKIQTYVSFDKNSFDKQIETLRKKHGNVNPDAIAIGLMFKCQDIVGVCVASQANFGYVNNKLHVSVYGIGGASLGLAETLKVEAYVALCYGDCLGGLGQGIYVGADAGITIGQGFAAFIEVGTDLTEIIFGNTNVDLTDLWDYKTVYIGVAYNVGAGMGVSGVIYYYTNLWNKDILLEDIKGLEF